MRITANGKSYDIDPGTTVASFARSLHLDPRFVIVERNGQPLERARYDEVQLSEADRLELVQAVAGGDGRTPGSGRARGAKRRERLVGSRLYVVTDSRRGRGDLEDFLEAILEAGTDIIQLREKDAEGGDLLRCGELFRRAAERHGALFFVNDRPDVAVALGADGIHLGQNDLPPEVTRQLVGSDLLIGLSTHSENQLRGASPQADYVCVGPVHPTPTKPGRPAVGLEILTTTARYERRPWFAIGGINRETLAAVVGAGARRVVVVRAVTEAADPAAAVRSLLEGLPNLRLLAKDR